MQTLKKLLRLPYILIFVFFFALVIVVFPVQTRAEVVSTTSFSNPLVQGADPFITFKDGYYYYLKTQGSAIDVWKTRSLVDLEHATGKRVWTPPATGAASKNIWAPELHFLSGKWYIYYAADDGNDINHRMYVLEGTSADPQGTYVFKAKVYDTAADTWAIDGSVFLHSDGKLYLVWSGRPTNDLAQPQYLYLASMSNPWTLSSRRVAISKPTYAWEKVSGSVNEGPIALKRNGKTFIVYSASFFNTPDYKLGMLTYTSGNILSSTSWKKKTTPVFQKTTSVYGPGHNAFTQSQDGTEDWIVYHARNTTDSSEPRTTRAQKFTWNADGTPNFGTPISANEPIALPSADIPGDLLVDQFVLTDASGAAKTSFVEGEAIYPKVVLHNAGFLAADTNTGLTYTHFYSDAPSVVAQGTVSDMNVYLKNGEFPGEFVKEYGASPLGPNASFYAGAKSWSKPAGIYTARVFINYDHDGIESSYTNNQAIVTYTVIPASISATPTL